MALQQKSSQSKVANRQIRICIASNAGGSGKTTAAVHLAYAIAAKGFKVTIIELDISSSLSTFTGLSMNPDPQDSIAVVFEGLYGDAEILRARDRTLCERPAEVKPFFLAQFRSLVSSRTAAPPPARQLRPAPLGDPYGI